LPEDGDVPVGKCPSGGPTCEGDTNKSEISADEDGSSLDFLPCDACATGCEICGDDMGDHFVECVCGTDDKHNILRLVRADEYAKLETLENEGGVEP
jgi:hypothetical protein